MFDRRFLGIVAAALLGCGGGDDATSQPSSAASSGSGGASSSSSMSASTGGPASSSSTGAGGGGGGPVGTPYAYVGAGDGKIRVMSLDKTSGAMAILQELDAGANPSFLVVAPDKKSLYAVDEGADQIEAFSIDQQSGHLTALNAVSTNGSGPAHVAIDATGSYVFGVNYGGGSFTMVARNGDGSLGASKASLSTGKNAHELVLDPSNAFAFVPDLGSDRVSQLVFDAKAGTIDFNAVPSVALPAGSGPRHMAFHPTAPYAYLIRETDDTMTAFSFDANKGTLSEIQSLSTLPQGFDPSMNTCAEVAFGRSGRFLYGSNRGHDSIVIFDVDPATGMMTLVGHQPTGGMTPRQFSIDPSGDILLVGNQQSNDIITFHVDPNTGKLTQLATTPIPSGPEFVGVIYL